VAHFAELDPNNVVKQVIVVNNADTSTIEGDEKEYYLKRCIKYPIINYTFLMHC